MVTKEQIKEYKYLGNAKLKYFVQVNNDNKNILYILENLGYLPNDFDDSWVIGLIHHKNKNIRFWAVKTLGKTKKEKNIDILKDVAQCDESTDVRREAVSSIGRIKGKAIINTLIEFLNDNDPKIILQAIRGLLTFKGNKLVDKELKALGDHPNEMIQKVIKKEYYSSKISNKNTQPHSQSYNFLKNVVVLGDVRNILKLIPDESFHLTFTSPPYYNARDYSIFKSYKSYLLFLEEVFKLTFNKTKEGRYLIVNSSPIIIPRISRQHSSKRYPIPFDLHYFLVRMGWEFIDDIVWVKSEASVKNRNAGFLQHRKPLAYKPNARTEYLMVYRKQTEKLLDWNIRQYSKELTEKSKVRGKYETSNVWQIEPTFDKVHSAVFPEELCKRVIKFYSFKDDLIFDPFAGSGTFGKVALDYERYFFLTEINNEYFDYIKQSFRNSNLFTKKNVRYLNYKNFEELIKK